MASVCGNPMWLEWAEEIYQHAKEKDLQAHYTYKKACKSIRDHPIRYTNPRDILKLAFVGKGMVEKIEKKQKAHYLSLGLPPPSFGPAVDEDAPGPSTAAKRKATKKTPNGVDEESDGSDDPLDVNRGPKRPKTAKPKVPPKKKLYVPTHRSGNYAMLLALFLALPRDDQEAETVELVDLKQGWMGKAELVREAQEFCSVSMEKSETGGHYNGYSGIKTLTGNGCVYREGNPARFRLTELGYDTAKALVIKARSDGTIPPPNAVASSSHLPAAPKHVNLDSEDEEYDDMDLDDALLAVIPQTLKKTADPRAALERTVGREVNRGREAAGGGEGGRYVPYVPSAGGRAHGGGGWRFWYLDNSGKRVLHLSSAATRPDPELLLQTCHLEFPSSLRDDPEVTRLMLRDVRVKPGTKSLCTAWILEEDCAPAKCPGSMDEDVEEAGRKVRGSIDPSRSTLARAPNGRNEEGYPSNSPAGGRAFAPFPMSLSSPQSSPVLQPMMLENTSARSQAVNLSGKSRLVGGTGAAGGSLGLDGLENGNRGIASSSRVERAPVVLARPAPILAHDYPQASTSSVAPVVVAPPTTLENFQPPEVSIFRPGEYEILLLIDNREIKNQRDWNQIHRGLVEKGVKLETRPLVVGDMVWIAKHRDGRECVMDHVVERKRLDDLVSSITGGRYDEQKHRLKTSKLRNVYYIVEDWDIKKTNEALQKAVATTRSQLQVIHGIFMKDTHRLSETIDYLKVMTDTIKDLYKFEHLHVIHDHLIPSLSHYGLLQTHLRHLYPTRFYVTSYTAYSSLNSKSANCTLKETWTRMLLCIKGMSEEKVRAVVDEWGTPTALWEALEVRRREVGREEEEEKRQGGPGGKGGKSKVRGVDLFFADRFNHLPLRQKIGEALSRDMYLAICGE